MCLPLSSTVDTRLHIQRRIWNDASDCDSRYSVERGCTRGRSKGDECQRHITRGTEEDEGRNEGGCELVGLQPLLSEELR